MDQTDSRSLPVDELVARVGVTQAGGIKCVAGLIFTKIKAFETL